MAIPSRLGRRPGGQRFPLWHVPIVRKLWFGSACYPPNPAGWAKSVQDYASTLAGGVGCSSDAICRRVDQGYPYLFDFWKQGYRIDIDSDTLVRAVAANPLVVQDAGMVAMTGGSIVYWAEEMDNRANLRLLHLDGSALSEMMQAVRRSSPLLSGSGRFLTILGLRAMSTRSVAACSDCRHSSGGSQQTGLILLRSTVNGNLPVAGRSRPP